MASLFDLSLILIELHTLLLKQSIISMGTEFTKALEVTPILYFIPMEEEN
jgi:hypothetical protein